MSDPIAAGGGGAVRYALSTNPALIAMPIGLCIPLGARFGSIEGGMTTGFTAAIVLAMTAEYLRRGAIALKSSAGRRSLLQMLTSIYWATPLLAGLGLALGVAAIDRCGPTCSADDHLLLVVGLVFAIIALLASVALVGFLRSNIWAQQRKASEHGG